MLFWWHLYDSTASCPLSSFKILHTVYVMYCIYFSVYEKWGVALWLLFVSLIISFLQFSVHWGPTSNTISWCACALFQLVSFLFFVRPDKPHKWEMPPIVFYLFIYVFFIYHFYTPDSVWAQRICADILNLSYRVPYCCYTSIQFSGKLWFGWKQLYITAVKLLNK